MMAGEAEGYAKYVQENKRIPRRGEVLPLFPLWLHFASPKPVKEKGSFPTSPKSLTRQHTN